MFSIFPSDWEAPRPKHWFTSSKKPIHNLADHHFPPRTVIISRPVPEPVKTPVKVQIPVCEMCIGEHNDFTLVDKMLAEMETPSPESRAERILKMIKTVDEQLEKNIIVIRNTPAVDGDIVSRENLLKLLKMFSNYSKTIEQYIKEQTPSSL